MTVKISAKRILVRQPVFQILSSFAILGGAILFALTACDFTERHVYEKPTEEYTGFGRHKELKYRMEPSTEAGKPQVIKIFTKHEDLTCYLIKTDLVSNRAQYGFNSLEVETKDGMKSVYADKWAKPNTWYQYELVVKTADFPRGIILDVLQVFVPPLAPNEPNTPNPFTE